MNNNIYIYNDSFSSLLSLIKELLIKKIKPYNIKNNKYNYNLLDNLIYLKIEEDNIVDIYRKFLDKNSFKIIYYVYLSNHENRELIIFYYLLNYLKYREKTIYLRKLNCVNEALKISKKVSSENHKFKGFTRFKELKGGLLYAEIDPENNILPIISLHFKERLKNEYWMIKDKKREIISVYDKNNYYILESSKFDVKDNFISNKEYNIEKLWKLFYKTIGIKERKNDKCRMNFMPKKYWKNMLEVSDEI